MDINRFLFTEYVNIYNHIRATSSYTSKVAGEMLGIKYHHGFEILLHQIFAIDFVSYKWVNRYHNQHFVRLVLSHVILLCKWDISFVYDDNNDKPDYFYMHHYTHWQQQSNWRNNGLYSRASCAVVAELVYSQLVIFTSTGDLCLVILFWKVSHFLVKSKY